MPVKIAPHRAVYKIKMASVRNGSNISGVNGKLAFEWRDVCDGWAIQQHMQLHFSYIDSDDQNFSSSELTWESKDGKSYRFNIKRTIDQQEAEVFRGKAVQNADGTVAVTYSLPRERTEHLPSGTLFPTAHTELLLKKAADADDGRFFMRRVFDGDDDSGTNDISAFVFPPRAEGIELDAKIKDDPLLKVPAWPVHLAFFKVDKENGEPEYEMDLNLLSNGIADHMKIDYGDYSVVGVLEEIKPIEVRGCP